MMVKMTEKTNLAEDIRREQEKRHLENMIKANE
jgi:hypothetical protein